MALAGKPYAELHIGARGRSRGPSEQMTEAPVRRRPSAEDPLREVAEHLRGEGEVAHVDALVGSVYQRR